MIPAFVSEGSIRKYHRAVAALKAANKPVTDEAIKELYTLYGGLVLDEVADEVSAVEVEAEAPRRRARKAE